ncbi:MAG: hypothetical protein C0595_05330 [Marinilabiliales bacterium]|nr:MAG: hypothetical protein C0595_05330 [Marinilabiliales bacterium]
MFRRSKPLNIAKMKKLITLISLATLFLVFFTNTLVSAKTLKTKSDSIHVWCSPNLAEIATSWMSEYTHLNSEIKMGLKVIDKEAVPLLMQKPDYLGFFSNDFLPLVKEKPVWKMAVARNVIVPVINSKNPFLNKIQQQGITPDQFAKVFGVSSNQSWGILLDDEQLNSSECYCFGDQNVDACLSKFLKTNQQEIHYINVSGKEEFISEILSNPYSIGFCSLIDVMDAENQKLLNGISIVPIDKNGNNKVDYFEDIYSSYDDLSRGIWIGKYPRDLYENIYAVSGTQPRDGKNVDFLEWVLTEGQPFLFASGYSELVFNERKSKIEDLTEVQTPIIEAQTNTSQAGMILIFIGLIALGVLILFLVFYFKSEKKDAVRESLPNSAVFGEHSITAPSGLFFDKSHTWAFMEKEGAVRIGIDDFLQHVTGSITKVKMKNPGEKITKGDTFLSIIQHGKQLDIKSPVSGIIMEKNLCLQNKSSIINSSPYGEGWVYKVKSDNWLKEIKSLFMGETYQIWLQNEFIRLKDFLTLRIKPESSLNMQVVMQDGGEIKDNLLEEFGPQVWEEFQNEIINKPDKM